VATLEILPGAVLTDDDAIAAEAPDLRQLRRAARPAERGPSTTSTEPGTVLVELGVRVAVTVTGSSTSPPPSCAIADVGHSAMPADSSPIVQVPNFVADFMRLPRPKLASRRYHQSKCN
jgi:hypothetical protein